MSPNKIHEGSYSSTTNNPCMKESGLSMKCLDENKYDYDMCRLYFDNYKNCKKFWQEVKWSRQRQGIKPALPEPEERDKIKEEYLKKMKK